MLVLMENEICRLAPKCPHREGCWGAKPNRDNKFMCEFVDNFGNIREDCYRNPHDKTGKMNVILEW